MFCTRCGGELRPQDRFCAGCGSPISEQTAPQDVPAAAPSVVVAEPQAHAMTSAQHTEAPPSVRGSEVSRASASRPPRQPRAASSPSELAAIATEWGESVDQSASSFNVRIADLRRMVAPTLWDNLDDPLRADPGDLARLIASRPDALAPLCAAFVGSVSTAFSEEPTVALPGDTGALTRRALWAAGKGWLDEAVDDVQAVLAISAFDAQVWYCLGVLCCLQGSGPDAASDAFTKCARYLGEDRVSTAAFAWLAAASALEVGGLESEAATVLGEATSKFASPELHVALARVSGSAAGLEVAFQRDPTFVFDCAALQLVGLDERVEAAVSSLGPQSVVEPPSEDGREGPPAVVLAQLARRWSTARREYRRLGGTGSETEPTVPPEPKAPIRLAVTGPTSEKLREVVEVETRQRDEDARYGQAVEIFQERAAKRQAALEEHAKWERRRELMKVASMNFDATATADNLLEPLAKQAQPPRKQQVAPVSVAQTRFAYQATAPVRRPVARKRSAAWIYYTFLSVASLFVVLTGQIAAGLGGFVAFGAYATYLYRGGRIVIWFWTW
jgi:hypothetical protein